VKERGREGSRKREGAEESSSKQLTTTATSKGSKGEGATAETLKEIKFFFKHELNKLLSYAEIIIMSFINLNKKKLTGC